MESERSDGEATQNVWLIWVGEYDDAKVQFVVDSEELAKEIVGSGHINGECCYAQVEKVRNSLPRKEVRWYISETLADGYPENPEVQQLAYWEHPPMNDLNKGWIAYAEFGTMVVTSAMGFLSMEPAYRGEIEICHVDKERVIKEYKEKREEFLARKDDYRAAARVMKGKRVEF